MHVYKHDSFEMVIQKDSRSVDYLKCAVSIPGERNGHHKLCAIKFHYACTYLYLQYAATRIKTIYMYMDVMMKRNFALDTPKYNAASNKYLSTEKSRYFFLP